MKRFDKRAFTIILLIVSFSAFAEGQMDDTPCEYTSESNTRYNPKADIREMEQTGRPQPASTVTAQ